MSLINSPIIPIIHPGSGRISLSSHGSSAVLSELSSTYPLKLLSPRITQDVAVVYILTYGGGLVGGDQINLSVDVDSGTVLVLLSQGSTKVFKTRPGQRLATVRIQRPISSATVNTSSPEPSLVTMQNMTFVVAAEGALFLLPDPVTCFQSSSYTQTQKFQLSGTASLVVLDWLTSGRKSIGEEWSFSRYYSSNEVWVDGKRVARDTMLLNGQEVDSDTKLPSRTLGDKLAPYSCYAMVILYGPLVQGTIHDIAVQYDRISIFDTKVPAEMVWSLSPMTWGGGGGAVIRIAGIETEIVKKWLYHSLMGIQEAIGIDVYRRALG